jgi:thioester reductase-like protein
MQVHLISTAYVCGFIRGRTVYEVNHPRGDFINVYEESKWEAEQIWLGNATVLRPSIIVGDSETGRSTTFAGLYILFQATDLLARLVSEVPGADRHNLRLDIPADPNGTANIIPVNYVAKAAIRIIEDPANYNQIFHLTHPNPPLHRLTMDVVCRRFDIGGINFVGEDSRFSEPRNRIERMVFKQMEAIRVYFSTNPIFDRTNTDSALADLEVPAITESFLDKILDYAIEKNWGHLPQ